MVTMIDFNIAIAVFCIVISVIILISITFSEHRNEKSSRIFIYMIIVNLVLLVSSIIWFVLNNSPFIKNPLPLLITECVKASCGPVMLILYTRLIMIILKERTVISKKLMFAARIAIALCIADIIVILIEPFVFTNIILDENNRLVRPEWYIFSYIFTFMSMAINTGILFVKRIYLKMIELLTLLAYIVIPALGIVIHMMVEGTPVNMISITVAIIFYFAIIQNELSKQAHELEKELVESRISVMMSQIQPHFLYNILTAIVQLCDENPALAKKTVLDFSAYLRSNMESLNYSGLISVEKELDHVSHYLSLEKTRFGKALDIEYIIETGGFGVPPLTIQPIVENAVKHGISKKEDGGKLTVSVSETEEWYLVTVTDDGLGYEIDESQESSTRHIGINNVRKRLLHYGGTLEISSKSGQGTIAIIRLPKYNKFP